MTAEVAVLNSQGVALAADSAVTLGDGKIYNSVEKLFRLSEVDPVAFMIYGNGSCCGTPWELVVKQFRELNSKVSFNTVKDYADNFINYIKNQTNLITKENRDHGIESILDDLYRSIFKKLHENIQRALEAVPSHDRVIGTDETLAFISSILDSEAQILEQQEYRLDFNAEVERSLFDDYSIRETLLNPARRNLSHIYQYVEDKCLRLSILYLTRVGSIPSSAGLVFSGYGKEEFAPTVYTLKLVGLLGDYAIAEREQQLSHTSRMGASIIIPFAQADVVHSFISGFTPGLESDIYGWMGEAFNFITSSFVENIDSSLINKDNGDKESIYNQLHALATQAHYQFQVRFVEKIDAIRNPMVQMLAHLPKEEMAALAESLVQITALRRKMSNTLETVGGPVDVALVTKSDGFVWIKRKHYFERDLNYHFFQK